MNTVRWGWLRRIEKIFKVGLICFGLTLLALYVVLLASEAYSARQAKLVLSKLELLRPGEPAGDFWRAVGSCQIEKDGNEYVRRIAAPPHRAEWFWRKLSDLLGDRSDSLIAVLNYMGLRWWRLGTVATVHDEKIVRIRTDVWVIGRYELLGGTWEIADQLSEMDNKLGLGSDDQRTYMHWYHITSVPSGEGFSVTATSRSTEKELSARHISAHCLLSFKGCQGLCELMPDVVPVLDDRGRGIWGCVWGVPPAKCRSKYDELCPGTTTLH